LWEGSVRVPLIISVPGTENSYGTSCDNITELIDLYPTLTELCGFKGKEPKILQGKSLVENINHPDKTDNEGLAYTVSYGGNDATIRTAQYRYTRWGNNTEIENEELYNHEKDPEEHFNLADEPEYKNILEEMRNKLEAAQEKAVTGLD
jgi:arylsulfatase A-like enzyme